MKIRNWTAFTVGALFASQSQIGFRGRLR